MIRVLVNGAAGRMGSEVVRSVLAEDGLELCGGVDIGAAGKDLGEVIGIGHNGMTIDKTLEEAFAKGKPDVIVDFTSPKVIYENAKYVLENGVNIVIGTTGLTAKQREELAGIAEKTGANGLVAPNFSLGAVLLMKVSAEISKYMPNAEIIELHHNHKYDAPSGTAKLTAEKWQLPAPWNRKRMKQRKVCRAFAAANTKGSPFTLSASPAMWHIRKSSLVAMGRS